MLIEEDEESGEGIGNLCIKSPGMFHEYWRLPQVHNINLLNFNRPEMNMQLIVVYGSVDLTFYFLINIIGVLGWADYESIFQG